MKAVDASGSVLVGDFPCRKVHRARGLGERGEAGMSRIGYIPIRTWLRKLGNGLLFPEFLFSVYLLTCVGTDR